MAYDKAIKTPILSGGVGWQSIGKEELEIATELLTNPELLWRYRKDSYTTKFEQEACEMTGAKHALFVNSGTSALSCCLASLHSDLTLHYQNNCLQLQQCVSTCLLYRPNGR